MSRFLRSTFRIDTSEDHGNIPRQNETHDVAYTYSGKGFLHGFALEFNSEKVEVKLTVDSEVIFDIDCGSLMEALPNNMKDTKVISSISFDKGKDIFSVEFPGDMLFSESVLIEVRANYNNPSRKLERQYVFISKEL